MTTEQKIKWMEIGFKIAIHHAYVREGEYGYEPTIVFEEAYRILDEVKKSINEGK